MEMVPINQLSILFQCIMAQTREQRNITISTSTLGNSASTWNVLWLDDQKVGNFLASMYCQHQKPKVFAIPIA
jgi:hypothetical protein